MSTHPKFESIQGQRLTHEQSSYLDGFFAGLVAKGVSFGDVVAPPTSAPVEEAIPLIFEERVKKEEHPLDSYYLLAEAAAANRAPTKEETYRFKWNGLFYLSPVKDAYMARLRIPGGQLKTFQLREIARIASELTSGYVQITTRANLQIRLIEPKNTVEVLRRIQSVGLHTRGAGADNIRNLTGNPTAGIDPHELIDCTPFVNELGQQIISHREFYDLPRKFNIAFDGGGLIGSVEDTNDIGVKAVRQGEVIGFRIALGGATGHKAFARDLGVFVPPEKIIKVVLAILRVYIANGNRGDRKKARLKHLLETWSLEKYLEETERKLGGKLDRLPLDPAAISYPHETVSHSHVGVFPQRQKGLSYIGVAMPVGHVTPAQLQRLCDIADNYGTGELRLTVWQNLIIPNISDAFVATVRKALKSTGFATTQTNVSSGVIACTGSRYCKFAAADTKGHALELIRHLERKIELDVPVNIHVTGCANSCAQHYMGDIGLLGVKTRDGMEAYHVFVGGGFGTRQAVGRQVYAAMIVEELKPTVERMLRVYLRDRQAGESFQQFTARHDLNALQTIFSE